MNISDTWGMNTLETQYEALKDSLEAYFAMKENIRCVRAAGTLHFSRWGILELA